MWAWEYDCGDHVQDDEEDVEDRMKACLFRYRCQAWACHATQYGALSGKKWLDS